ncbi:methylenetetrahydrofolate dehydrogenase [Nitzschia inconspicua]|uniref:Methylenetetrahydrofolate dehydrogenase n=1 Tax=Nitzschia inconspicua TaxID=303405 RepID=A0A9K3Q134_9STRA|nr:methylenetetrahydrofolate dehydrogenase [Nitzschia inconspicua]
MRSLARRELFSKYNSCHHRFLRRQSPLSSKSCHRRWFHDGFPCCHTSSSTSSVSIPTVEQVSTEKSIWEHPSVIDVTPLAESLRQHIREFTSQKKESLTLVGILANQGPHRHDAIVYAESIQENCEQDGIQFELWSSTAHVDGCGDTAVDGIHWIQEQIKNANESQHVDGILVFYPIYQQQLLRGPYKDSITGVYYKTCDDYIRDLVLPTKDVEGLCGAKWLRVLDDPLPTTQSNFLQLYPCTALSVLWSIEAYHLSRVSSSHSFPGESMETLSKYSELHVPSCKWKNLTVSIINRSEIMGRPLAVMLARKGATVYSIDIDSILQFQPNGRMQRCNPADVTLQSCLASSNVVVTGVPDPNYQLPLDYIQENSTIISVSEYTNVCEATLLSDRPDIHYIPQVGKVTVAVLENNLVHLKKFNLEQSQYQ